MNNKTNPNISRRHFLKGTALAGRRRGVAPEPDGHGWTASGTGVGARYPSERWGAPCCSGVAND